MLCLKQIALTRRRPRIAYVFWSLNQENYNSFVKKYRGRYVIEFFDLSDFKILKKLRNALALKSFDVVIDDFSKHPAINKEAMREFYNANISRAILRSEELGDKDVEFKIQYKAFVNWNLPSETRKKLLNLSEKTLHRLIIENIYFKDDLMKGMIAFDRALSLSLFSRFSHQTILDLLKFDAEKIMEMHFSSSNTEKEQYISKSCWQHVSASRLLKAFNAFAWQNPELKDLDLAAMIFNVFQSIILKDQSVIKLNDQVEMIQVGVQLGNQVFDALIGHYPWLYFYFRELVSIHKNSEVIEVEQMHEMLKVHASQAHIYRDVIELTKKLLIDFSGSIDFDLLWAFVFERGYADEVIEYLLIHLLRRSLITENEKNWFLHHKKNGFKSLWQKSA